jgi:copper(I)-binding protein
VRVLGAESEIADKVEIHAMSMDGGVMRMRPLTDGLDVPAGGQVELKPSGMHLMLIGLKRPLVESETIAITLLFDGGVRLEAKLTVEALGGTHGP